MKKIILYLFFISLPFTCMFAQETTRLIQDADEFKPAEEGNLFFPYTRIKYIKLNPKIDDLESYQKGTKIIIDLFDEDTYLCPIDRISTNIIGTLTIRARIENYPMGYFILSVTNGYSLGYLIIPERNEKYRISTSAKSGNTYLKQVNITEVEHFEESPPMIPPAKPEIDEEQIQKIKETFLNDPEEEAKIDIMVVYTPLAAYWAYNYNGSIFNTVALAIELAQLALDNTNVGIELNLVHSALVDYEETEDSSIDLCRLTTSGDYSPWGIQYEGYMEEVHDWRNTYGADLTALLAEVTDVGGRGWLLNYQSGYPEFGFSLTSTRAASDLSFIHEIGHNMGAHHHKEQNTGAGPTVWQDWPENTWSAGWRWQGDDTLFYCDLMTYPNSNYWNDGNAAQRIPYFSNPDITYNNQPAGDAIDGDNARTLRETKHVIAANRPETKPVRYALTLYDEPQAAAVVMGSGKYAGGTTVHIYVRENYNYAFENWRDENHVVVGEQASFSFEMPSHDVKYYAHFKPLIHNITFNVKDQNGKFIENAQVNISSGLEKSKKDVLASGNRQHNNDKFKREFITDLPEPSNKNNPAKFSPANFAGIADGEQWIHWDSGENLGCLGWNKPMNFDIASRWNPSDLTLYHGEAISEIRFFPRYEDAVYTVKIWAGEDAHLLYSQGAENIDVHSWNTVKLNMPVFIDSAEVLWFGVNINTQGGWPAGRDNGPAVAGKGDLINVMNSGWFSTKDQWTVGDKNWNLHALVGDFVIHTNDQGQTNFESKEGCFTYNVQKFGYTDTSGIINITDTDLIIDVVLEQDVTGISEPQYHISISPNPTNNQIFIKADALIEKVFIVDRIGKDVLTERINNHEAIISLSHLRAGLYMIWVYSEKEVVVKKLIVQ